MPKTLHKRNKRMPARTRYKILKKVREHNRKVRRDQKKNPSKYKRKDPGVPNSLPFKDEILIEAEQRKKRAIDLQEAQKASREKLQMENRNLEDIVEYSQEMEDNFVETAAIESEHQTHSKNFKSYYKELKNVVDNADVILEILDARDPLGSRCPQIEEMVVKAGKKLVLVINKIDLIPRANLEAWLKYIRQELPAVAFKSSTQMQNHHLSRSKVAAIHISESLQESSRCVGASFLMKVLGNYCRNQDIKTSIIVGVVGFPNVGKSSVINSLKRSRTCTVGASAGVTKSVQEVALDKHIKILDSPGVVFAKDGSQTTLALRNAVRVDTLKDVIEPAEAIVERANHSQLCLHYTVPEFSSCHELLCLLAKRMGKFKKGGIPNAAEGAKRLINDWNRGYIKYYTHPPETFSSSEHIPVTIVSEFSKAFDISAMEESMELDKAAELLPSSGIALKPTKQTEGYTPNDNENEIMEIASSLPKEQPKMSVEFKRKKWRKKVQKQKQFVHPDQQKNKSLKKQFKKNQRMRKKADKTATSLSNAMDSSLTI